MYRCFSVYRMTAESESEFRTYIKQPGLQGLGECAGKQELVNYVFHQLNNGSSISMGGSARHLLDMTGNCMTAEGWRCPLGARALESTLIPTEETCGMENVDNLQVSRELPKFSKANIARILQKAHNLGPSWHPLHGQTTKVRTKMSDTKCRMKAASHLDWECTCTIITFLGANLESATVPRDCWWRGGMVKGANGERTTHL